MEIITSKTPGVEKSVKMQNASYFAKMSIATSESSRKKIEGSRECDLIEDCDSPGLLARIYFDENQNITETGKYISDKLEINRTKPKLQQPNSFNLKKLEIRKNSPDIKNL